MNDGGRHERPLGPDTALGTLVGQFDEQALVSLLVARFRCFIALGYPETEALLAAVGYTT